MTFSCYQRLPLLTNDAWRTLLAIAIRNSCDKYEVALWAYVFMPEHVHLLLKPRREKYRMATFEQSMKTASALSILRDLKRQEAPVLKKLLVQERPGRWIYRLWQVGGGHDLNIWSMKKAVEKAEYCHGNPVKRRLVPSAEKWRWSSFRWLVQGKRTASHCEWTTGMRRRSREGRLVNADTSSAIGTDVASPHQWHPF